MDHLVRQRGTIVKVKEGLYFHREAIESIRARLVEFIKSRGQASTQEIKDLLGLSRKFLIPLVEYFDAAKVTMRIGEVRVLRGQAPGSPGAQPPAA